MLILYLIQGTWFYKINFFFAIDFFYIVFQLQNKFVPRIEF